MTSLRGSIVVFSLFIGSFHLVAQVPEPRTRPASRAVPEAPRVIMAAPLAPSEGDSRLFGLKPVSSTHSLPIAPRTASVVSVSTFFVTSVEDSGAGTLRQAIEDANSSPGHDMISFQLLPGGRQIIAPRKALPLITDPVTIDGSTAIGYYDQPVIQIDGSQAGTAFGLHVTADGCVFRALSITRFSNSGIVLLGGSTTVEGCYLGVEPDGKTAAGNGMDGLTVYTANNWIGGVTARPNVVSGNKRSGIVIEDVNATGNIVVNCFAGTNAAATAALPNVRWGIEVVNATDAMIGGTASHARNILSGNGNAGVGIRGLNARRVKVQGNFIGTGEDSRIAIPNQNHGVEIASAPERGSTGSPSDILIGGQWNSAEKNIISGNRGSGVAVILASEGGSGIVVAGNVIGLDEQLLLPVPNQYGISLRRDVAAGMMPGVRIGGIRVDSSNVIAGNSFCGMYLYGDGVRNTLIRGNHIGVAPQANGSFLAQPNLEAGIVLEGAGANEIGGRDTLSANIICANRYGGISIYGDNASGNTIVNNYIGTAPGRPRTLGNGYNGIYVQSPGNTIGKLNADRSFAGNIIAHNAQAGIYVASGQGNSLRGNVLYRNGTMGIDLAPGGITANDTTDADAGANTLVNFPIIESCTWHAGTTDIQFRILGEQSKAYHVDFYTIDTLSASLFGEGSGYMGSATVTTDADGKAMQTVTLPVGVYSWQHVTAMATDADGNSSEFCRAFCMWDADRDGLMDCWEKQGIGMDIDMDGLVDLDLYARGAAWDHKDLFVEVDRMEGMEFSFPAREMATSFFRTAPNSLVDNPDKRDGISLHITYGYLEDSVAKAYWPASPWAEFHAAKRKLFGTDLERIHPNGAMIIEAKKRVYRYCIFANRYGTSGSSGLAEKIIANDFIVSLGNWSPVVGGTVEEQAGTFVHELGHTLGLRHGGCDNINWKPNYISVMNYYWQFPKDDQLMNKLSWKIVYSPSALLPLDESSLNEKLGLNVPEGIYPGTIFAYGNKVQGFRTGVLFPGAAVDWNGDKDSSSSWGVPMDINGVNNTSPGELLLGFSDWPNLVYSFRESSTYPDPSPKMVVPPSASSLEEEPEMTWMLRDSLATLPSYGFLPPAQTPYLFPRDTNAVGGNYGGVQLNVPITAPAGGLTYYFKSSAPDLLTVDRTIRIYEGGSTAGVGFTTIGVEHDTTVFILGDSLRVPLKASVRIRAASLNRLDARTDSGCAVTQLGGFRNKFISGSTILLEATLDGQAPPAGETVRLSSSRPDLIAAPALTPIGAFGTNSLITVHTSRVSAPEAVILTASYRDTSRSVTVTLMPAPHYGFKDLGSTGSSAPELKINNAGRVLVERRGFLNLKDESYAWLSRFPGFRLWNVLGINDSGWVCGSVLDSGTVHEKPAYWKPDTTIVLPTLDAANPSALANAMNDRGELVGVAIAEAYPYFQTPVIWRNGVISKLEQYEQYWLNPLAINDSGQVAGSGIFYQSSPYIHRWIGVRWDKGVLTRIVHPVTPIFLVEGVTIAADGTGLFTAPPLYYLHKDSLSPAMAPAAPFVQMKAFDMNDAHDVVGGMTVAGQEDGQYIGSPFVLRGGYQYNLTCLTDFPPAWTDFTAVGINNSGTIVGRARDGAGGSYHIFVLTPDGAASVRDESGADAQIPVEFRLMQNYPNPFNPTTVIRYGLPQAVRVQLEVFSILGQRVRTLVDERQPAGEYEVRLNASALASGVYFYRLKAGEFLSTKRMLILK